MSKTMIEVSDVSMRFRMNSDRIMSLKEFVTTALRGKLRYQEFTALEYVSFTVKKGETLGHPETHRGQRDVPWERGAHAGAGVGVRYGSDGKGKYLSERCDLGLQ